MARALAITGPYGLVGRRLLAAAPGAAALDIAPAPKELAGKVRTFAVDIGDAGRLTDVLKSLAGAAPLVVVHLAALTDTAGTDEALYEKVNVRGTENVLRAAQSAGAGFIHLSTDYVFAGEARDGAFGEEDRPRTPPPGAYAASKFRAENLVLDAALPRTAVARIAFPYGGLGNRPGLEDKMVARFQEARRTGEAVTLFDDQTICPAYLPDVTRGLLLLADRLAANRDEPRVFHLVGEATTPFRFGGLVRRRFGFEDVRLEASSVKGTRYAANLRLSTGRTREVLGWASMPHDEALNS